MRYLRRKLKDLRLRQAAIIEMLHPRPGPGRTALLTATTQLMEPELSDFGHELIQANVVVRDGVVSKPSAWPPKATQEATPFPAPRACCSSNPLRVEFGKVSGVVQIALLSSHHLSKSLRDQHLD